MSSPEKRIRAGGVSATIWNNTQTNSEGKEYSFYSVRVERSFKDKEGNWRNTSNFRVQDLPKVELVSRKAFEYLSLTDGGQEGNDPYAHNAREGGNRGNDSGQEDLAFEEEYL